MDTISIAFAVSLLMTGPQTPPSTQAGAPVQCEFRVFDGSDEVSATTRIRVYPAGQRSDAVATDARGRAPLAPGLYDVQAIRERDGQVTGIRWIEQLLIQRYPDEQGRHLEVINFKAHYGALELRTGGADYDVSAFPAGQRSTPAATGVAGAGYVLVVVPAGRYDVRVRAKGSTADIWLPEVDVPVGRTRLRTIRPSGGPPQTGI